MIRPFRSLLSEALHDRVEQLSALQASSRQEAELIHEIRVAVKQFRAQLPLLRTAAGDLFCDRQDRMLARTARSLAADRDLLVVRETMEWLARKCDRFTGRDSLHRLLLHLGEERINRQVQTSAVRAAFATLLRSGAALRRRLRGRPSDADLVEAFRQAYRQVRRLTAKCRHKAGKESWHRWRKRVKALHYQAAGLQAARPRKLGRLAKRCWRLQALLGKHHDLHMARERLSRLRIDPINEPCRVRAQHVIDRELARLETKVLRITKSFLPQPSKTFTAKLKPSRQD